MSIALTEEHRALADTVRRWAADADVLTDTRERFEADVEERPAFLADLGAQGLLGIHLPEEHGGTGYGLAELAVEDPCEQSEVHKDRHDDEREADGRELDLGVDEELRHECFETMHRVK